MKGFIVVNAYINNNSQLHQSQRLAEEFKNLGVEVEVVKNFDLARILNGQIEAKKSDFCVFLDKDRVAARLLEKSGLRLFNRAEAIEVCDDKLLTHTALSNGGFSMPDCVYSPLCYNNNAAPDPKFLDNTVNFLGLPLIAKVNYGSLGAGVCLINDYNELLEYEKTHLLVPHFYQRFIAASRGEDVRVIVIGGKFVCAMKRSNKNDFRSNIELGGKGENFPAPDSLKTLCEVVAAKLNLDYCGIDVLHGSNGEPYICEVNSNAFFAAAERCCDVNVARTYAEYILKTQNK